MHDKNPAVRLALVKLLVRVSSIRNIHFYEIVPIEELHQRLVLDQNRPAIMTQLSSLLLRSYFPQVGCLFVEIPLIHIRVIGVIRVDPSGTMLGIH